jgi:hypothetical protein
LAMRMLLSLRFGAKDALVDWTRFVLVLSGQNI